jgi:hypothetical protein
MKMLFEFDCKRLQEPAHSVSTAMIWCVERRIRGLRGKFAASMGISEHIPIIIPGGIKRIAKPDHPRDSDILLRDIQFLQDKLGLTRLYAMAHFNCAACGSHGELAYYQELLQDGAEILRKYFPKLEVFPILADFKGIHLIESRSSVAA